MPSSVCRIQEITCRALCRIACNGASHPLRTLATLRTNPRPSPNLYHLKLIKFLTKFGVLNLYLILVITPCYPSWRPHTVSVDVEQLAKSKHSWFPRELQAHFIQKLTNYSQVHALHFYCDGSIDGSKSGCGLFICNYTSHTEYTNNKVSRRLPDHLSSSTAELYAIFEGLHIILSFDKDVYFLVDS